MMPRVITTSAILRFVALMLGLAAFSACIEKERQVRLAVDVKTNREDPVAGAVVSLDGQAIGETDLQGRFHTELNLPNQARVRLEVRKESDTYYFAPFFESFVVGEGRDDAELEERSFTAVLYFVPKPKPGVAENDNVLVVDESAVSGETLPGASQAATEAAVPAAGANMPEVTPESPAPEVAASGITAEVTAEIAKAGATPAPAIDPSSASVEASATTLSEAPAPASVPGESTAEEALIEAVTEAISEVGGETEAKRQPEAEGQPEASGTIAALSTVQSSEGSSEDAAGQATAPAVPEEPAVLTVHTLAGGAAVAGVEVSIGEENGEGLRSACTTNERGRCVVRFTERPTGNVTLVASKQGYKSVTLNAPIPKNQGILKIPMERGHTLDIFALTRRYNYSVGLKDVEVIIDGRRVGVTDRFGRYSHVYNGKADAMMTIALKPRGYLPETYETDFVAAGPMKLVKYFAPSEPPPVRMTVLPPRPAGTMDKDTLRALSAQIDDVVRLATRKHLFATSAFKEYPLSLFERASRRADRAIGSMLRAGWRDTDIKAVVDALLVPTAIVGAKPALELSVIDSVGRVIAAAREDLDGFADKASIDRAVAVLTKKIVRAFPFEGAVAGKDADKVELNIGYAHGRGIKAGDLLDVYGIQTEKSGQSRVHGRIATLGVREVYDGGSKAAVTKLEPRATIERGDLVVLRPRKVSTTNAAQVRVQSEGDGKTTPVAQANVYFNDRWLGATDADGRLYLDATGSGTLKIVKQGFAVHTQAATLASGKILQTTLKRQVAFLRVESQPSHVAVKIDGKVVGKTPVSTPIEVPTGFVKVELAAPSGFKPYSAVFELDEGTLDLSGSRAINLEQDYRAQAQRLLKSGKVDEALAVLEGIPETHSDYLLGWHEAGELYLTLKNDPAKAAGAFGRVTADRAVAHFSDKRYIGSHINEGIALYLTAESLAASRPEESRAHYLKAIEVLEKVVPHLRFVAKDQYAQAVHNVDYHRALARHRLWASSKDPAVLADAVRTWRTYLDGSARSIPASDASKAYVENAQVYLKQALASMEATRNVSRQ